MAVLDGQLAVMVYGVDEGHNSAWKSPEAAANLHNDDSQHDENVTNNCTFGSTRSATREGVVARASDSLKSWFERGEGHRGNRQSLVGI